MEKSSNSKELFYSKLSVISKIVSDRSSLNSERMFFLTPMVVFMVGMILIPCLVLLYISFTNWEIGQSFSEAKFVGFRNYIRLFTTPRFWEDSLTTLYWILGCLGIELPLGLGIALILKAAEERKVIGSKIFDTLFLLPLAVAPVVTAVMWRFMYNGSYGIINWFCQLFGLPRFDWLGSKYALLSLIITDVWEFTPLFILLIFSALQTIPPQIEEAAKIDGANYWRRLTRIIIPTIKPVLVTVFIIRTIDLLRWLVTIFIMTGGGPGTRTEILNVLLYYTAFWQFSMDRASALAILMLGIGGLFAFISMKTFLKEA